jgi:prevent-host-death family protein
MSTDVSITEARAHLAETLGKVRPGSPVNLLKQGRRAYVVVDPDEYDALIAAAEDESDVAAVDAALAEGGTPVPLEEVMRDLGWTP